VAAKVINIQVPFFFKDIVDTLSIAPTAGAPQRAAPPACRAGRPALRALDVHN
jgi:hypothetical protein